MKEHVLLRQDACRRPNACRHAWEPVLLIVTVLIVTLLITECADMEKQAPARKPEGIEKAPMVITLYTVSEAGNLIKITVRGQSIASDTIRNLGEPFVSVGVHVEGLAQGPDGMLYAAVTMPGEESVFYRIDLPGGAATRIGSMGHREVDGLGFNQDGLLYGVTSRVGGASDSMLVTVDIDTGKATPVKKNMRLFDLDALAVSPCGAIIVTDGIGIRDHFYTVPLKTASRPVPLGPTPDIIPWGRDVEGLTFGGDGFMYATTNASQTQDRTSYLVRIDPKTFTYENLGNLKFGASNLAVVTLRH